MPSLSARMTPGSFVFPSQFSHNHDTSLQYPMMLFLQLPPEILRQIFDYCGSPYFQQDARRLTLNRHWHQHAIAAFWKRISLSYNTLSRFIDTEILQNPSRLQRNVEILEIKLGGDQNWHDQPDENADTAAAETLDGDTENVHSIRINKLNNDLSELAMITRKSPKLHTLRIQAWPPPHVDNFAREAYICPTTLQAFLSLKHLRTLELDAPNWFCVFPNEQENGEHVCAYIRPLLHTLTTLHLCLPKICPIALTPVTNDATLVLKNVIINLSLYRDIPGRSAALHSSCCRSYSETTSGDRGGLAQLMKTQAQRLVEQMVSPETVRVLGHTLLDVKVRSIDVLSGRTMILEKGAAWSDDGKVEEEFDPDSEFTDSDADDSFFDSD